MIMSRNYFFYNLLISFKYSLQGHLPTSILYTPNNRYFLSLLQQAGYKCCYSVLFILCILLESIFPTQELLYPPMFDGRVVLYPSEKNLRDYMSWRQADCHINNLYNTCFWCLVKQSGLTAEEAEERLNGTVSSDKNELLFSVFNMNYNNLPQIYRKGSVLVWERVCDINDTARKENARKPKRQIVVHHTDIIGDTFWSEHPEILDS